MNEANNPTEHVLAQADALMRRHRVFVAGANANQTPPELPPLSEEEIPTLTEIVDEAGAGFVPMPDMTAKRIEAALASQREQIEQALEQWLDKELPNEILRVLDGVSDQLIGHLVNRMRTELLPKMLAPTVSAEGDPADRAAQPVQATEN